MSLRIVPAASHPNQKVALNPSAPSAPGVHDTLRTNLSLNPSTASTTSQTPQLTSAHPLESRLANWRSTQEALKMELLRREFGLAEPVKRGMEAKIVRQGEWRPAVLDAGAGALGDVHGDVLAGRDLEIGWEDVYRGQEMRECPDFHSEMEARLKMNW
ncbi:proteasome maturation factor Ump1 [Delphinella strobiligena]|nr:proteasome maturation factor Ump1 [Delphinella strobiligena]